MANDNQTISLSENEALHLAAGLGMLIEYLSGHMKVKTGCKNGKALMENIQTITESYSLSGDELVELLQKIPSPVLRNPLPLGASSNVSILPS